MVSITLTGAADTAARGFFVKANHAFSQNPGIAAFRSASPCGTFDTGKDTFDTEKDTCRCRGKAGEYHRIARAIEILSRRGA
jgi:hypothetical protein